VKSVRAGETETEGNMLDVRNGSPGLVTVTVSSNFCELSGTVSDTNGPVSDARILILSPENPTRPVFVKSDSSGAYKVRVAPGKYKLAVVDDEATSWGMQGPDLEDDDPETVDLNAGDKITRDLKPHR
jgi:hypothetical protein